MVYLLEIQIYYSCIYIAFYFFLNVFLFLYYENAKSLFDYRVLFMSSSMPILTLDLDLGMFIQIHKHTNIINMIFLKAIYKKLFF